MIDLVLCHQIDIFGYKSNPQRHRMAPLEATTPFCEVGERCVNLLCVVKAVGIARMRLELKASLSRDVCCCCCA